MCVYQLHHINQHMYGIRFIENYISLDCEDGWTEGLADEENGCYILIDNEVPFEEAQRLCEADNAILTSIRSEYEMNLIKDIMDEAYV